MVVEISQKMMPRRRRPWATQKRPQTSDTITTLRRQGRHKVVWSGTIGAPHSDGAPLLLASPRIFRASILKRPLRVDFIIGPKVFWSERGVGDNITRRTRGYGEAGCRLRRTRLCRWRRRRRRGYTLAGSAPKAQVGGRGRRHAKMLTTNRLGCTGCSRSQSEYVVT